MNVIPSRMRGFHRPTLIVKPLRLLPPILMGLLWFLAALFWPVLRWLLAFDVTLQFIRMLIAVFRHGFYIDWIFSAHFFFYVLLICFVTSKKMA